MKRTDTPAGARRQERADLQHLDRRAALSGLALGAGALAANGWPGMGIARAAARGAMPWLASPQQLEAEQMLMQVERDPQVKAIQAKLRADLAASTRAQMPAAAATLDNAIAQWTRSLIMSEVIKRPWSPVILWTTDDTPRTWLGHALGGVGTSGDNPDAIYRTGMLEGGGRYELLGRFHPDSRPTQLLIEVDAGDMTQPSKLLGGGGGAPLDIHSAALITDKQLVVNPDGTFRITVGGEADGPNHLALPPSGFCSIGSRDMLADWTLRPCQMTLRRLDKAAQQPFGLAELRQLVLADLDGYIRFWAHFPDIWMGALKPNTHAEPQARPGGWGFVAGLNYHLAPDEALLVTTSRGEAKYTGFQINDPWMIAPDARTRQVCLNTAQSTPNADGTLTYIIAKTDPGAANWLDTAGLDDGLAIMRWQQVPVTMTGAGLIRDFRVIKLSEVAGMKDLPRVTQQERRARVAARTAAYNTRVR
jgi:hypothetical protein